MLDKIKAQIQQNVPEGPDGFIFKWTSEPLLSGQKWYYTAST